MKIAGRRVRQFEEIGAGRGRAIMSWPGTEEQYGAAMLTLAFGTKQNGGEERQKPKLPYTDKNRGKHQYFLPKYILENMPITQPETRARTGAVRRVVSSAYHRMVKAGYLVRLNPGKVPARYDITPKGRDRLASGYYEKGGRPRGAYGRA